MKRVLSSKSGKELEVREPRFGDEQAMLDYINALIEEDTFIMMNEKQTPEEEKKFLSGRERKLKKVSGCSCWCGMGMFWWRTRK